MYKKIMPPTGLLAGMLLMVVLHLVAPLVQIMPPLWNLLGLVPLALGILINVSADRAFHRARTTVKPFDSPAALVTGGVFRLSRNPMYLGFVLILTGVAFLLGTLSPFLVILLFITWIERVYIAFEERALAEKFGAAWSAYRDTTRRWL